MENGPLMIIPGSHRGPIFDHHADGVFCGAMDPANRDVDFGTAIPLTGKAGSITVHHVRAVHGSAPNISDRDRRLLLFQFRAADAWPMLGFPGGIEAFDALMVCRRAPRSRGCRRLRCGCRCRRRRTAGLAVRKSEGHEDRYFAVAERPGTRSRSRRNERRGHPPPVRRSTFDRTRPLFGDGPPDPVVYDASPRACASAR